MQVERRDSAQEPDMQVEREPRKRVERVLDMQAVRELRKRAERVLVM